jgi:hypothetical protein
MRILSRLILGSLVAAWLFGAQPLFVKAEGTQLFFSPASGTNLVGSTFDVSVLLNTQGQSINTVQVDIKYPADKLRIVKPSSDRSLLAIWLEPPVYSNVNGTARLVGVIPNGVTTGSGLVSTITFEAIATGTAVVEIRSTSSVLANDGLGTETLSGYGRATYSLTPRPLEGVNVYSDTHPFSDQWYNNDNVTFSLEKSPGITDFSYEFDNKPFTVPDNSPDTTDDLVSFPDVGDGVWYFHVKARKEGVWGSPTHLLVRVDTQPPAKFKPQSEVLFSGEQAKVFISFFTTDEHSGISHYEVGVLAANQSADESPVFVRSESPYQLPNIAGNRFRVVVRAFDRAGNVVDEQISVSIGTSIISFFKRHIFILLGVGLAFGSLYFVFRLHIWGRVQRYKEALKRIQEEEHEQEELKHHHHDDKDDQPMGS